jgi:CubicO group peptidase (beta-lactamase class C family)
MLRLLPALLLGFLLTGLAQANAAAVVIDQKRVAETMVRAAELPRIHAMIVAVEGKPIVEHVFRGPALDRPVNIKSASKSIISALVGIAIDQGKIGSADQPILPLLRKRAPGDMDPKVATITVDHLLSMRAGLRLTS